MAEAQSQPAPLVASPTIREAERASGGTGAVLRGAQLDFDAAVARRKTGEDVVVCGTDKDVNRRLAGRIETGAGPATPAQVPHSAAEPQPEQ